MIGTTLGHYRTVDKIGDDGCHTSASVPGFGGRL